MPRIYAGEQYGDRAHIVACRVIGDHRMWLRFVDGLCGSFRVSDGVLELGAFASLRDPDVFALAVPDEGALVWPGGVRLDAQVLYHEVANNGSATRVMPPGRDVRFARFMARVLEPARKTPGGKLAKRPRRPRTSR